MKKISILRRKALRSYLKDDNWEHSIFKGYPLGTFFGYASFSRFFTSVRKEYTEYYGPTLRHWRYD